MKQNAKPREIILETDRLVLRKMDIGDLPALREIVQDEKTMYAWNGAWSEEETVEGLEKQLRAYSEDGFGRWAVVLRETNTVIGVCGLLWCDTDKDKVLEIGYLFNRAYWHKGYAAESAIACKNFAFDKLGYDEVFSLIRESNHASMNVAIRTGMLVRGSYIKQYKGEDMPHYIFSARKYNQKDELEIVMRLTGVDDENRIKINETGWTSRVYIIDGGKIVFKFPRNAKFREECKHEVTVLKLLREQKFYLSVPVLNWTTEDNSYFGYNGVEGKPLREVIGDLSDEQKIEIGRQIGKFLRQLHGMKISGSIKALTLEEQALEYQNWYRKGRDSLTEYFSETELMIIDDFFAHEVPDCMVGTNELVLCHGDLDYNNTLIDSKNQVGLIDFGDAGLYDRSQDFRGMEDDILLESMMMAYGGDKVISKVAAETTAKMIDALCLIYCIENNLIDGADNIENCLKQVRLKILKDEVV